METKAQEVVRRLFTTDEYHRMAETGILHEDDRVELIEGEVVEMPPIGGRHAACVAELTWLLGRQLSDEFRLGVRNPVKLEERGEPQPDLAVIHARNYAGFLPSPEDVLLLMEVSDTSLAYDRDIKLPLYARSGIGEVWILDLVGGTVERHTEPAYEGYRLVRRARRGETLRSEVLPDLVLPVDAMLVG